MAPYQHYFIEMGQGIIGKGPDFYVRTSALFSCTLICAYNSSTKEGGAFHYPAGIKLPAHKQTADDTLVIKAMESWIAELKPTQVTLLEGMVVGFNNNDADIKMLKEWLKAKVPTAQVAPVIKTVAGGMSLGGVPAFAANKLNNMPHFDPKGQKAFDLSVKSLGKLSSSKNKLPEIELFGKNLNKGTTHNVEVQPYV